MTFLPTSNSIASRLFDRLLSSTVSLPFSLPVGFSVEAAILLLAKRFIEESPILAVRSGERGALLLLLKMLPIADCVVVIIVAVGFPDFVIADWVLIASRYLR